MNIHVFHNDGQKILFDQYFIKTLLDEWKVISHLPPVSDACDYGTMQYMRINFFKISTLINEIIPSESNARFFILSDTDIQFFKKCDEIITLSMEKKDIVFQSAKGKRNPRINGGFIAMRPNEKVLDFWKQIENGLREHSKAGRFMGVQPLANQILQNNNKLRWGLFPNTIWAWTNPEVSPSRRSFRNIFLHHAVGTRPRKAKTSLELKIEQLEIVKTAYNYWAR